MPEQYANFATSTTAGLNNTTDPVTFSVATGDGALFPATANGAFHITVRETREVLKVTARTGDSLTASRAQEGTTATAAGASCNVDHELTRVTMDNIQLDWSGYGTFASLPGTGGQKTGMRYKSSDGLSQHVFDGTIWKGFGPLYPITPADSTQWTQMNAGSMTYVSGAGQMYIAIAESGIHLRGWQKTAPSVGGGGIWQCTFGCLISGLSSDSRIGVSFKENASGKLLTWGVHANGGVMKLAAEYWSSVSVYQTSMIDKIFYGNPAPLWLRLRYDGTNVYFDQSPDGINFTTWFQEAKAAHLTTAPDQVAIFIVGNTTETVQQQETVFSYLEESL